MRPPRSARRPPRTSREPTLHGRRELGPQLLELLEALLEVLALSLEVGEALLLRLVFLARERIDLNERDAPCLDALDAMRQLVAVIALAGSISSGGLESPRGFRDLGVDPRNLDLRGRHCGARLLELTPEVHLRRAERPQLLAELTRPRRTRVDSRTKRRLEATRRSLSKGNSVAEAGGDVHDPCVHARIERRGARAWRPAIRRLRDTRPAGGLLCAASCLRQLHFEPDGFRVERRTPTLQLEQHGLGGLTDEPELAATRVVPEALGRDRRRRRRPAACRSGRPDTRRRSPAAIGR